MTDEVIKKIYSNESYLIYLREHPKWYYYLDLNPKYLNDFINAFKKDNKSTTYDKLEQIKNHVNFASAMINYFNK